MTIERRDLGDGGVALVAGDLERAGFLAAFFERTGGRSEAPFDTLNGSFQVGDRDGDVAENRCRAAAAFGLERFCVPGLVHGTGIAIVGAARAVDGFHAPARLLASADGTTTRTAGIGLGAFSADCAIALLADPRDGRVALVHAGWRGLAAGIVQRGAGLFADRREVRAAIGPAIRACHYEVGEEVVRAVAAGSPAGAVSERRGGRVFLGLADTVRGILAAEGIHQVEDTQVCTACEPSRFFSYRRDGTTGRHLALAMRLPV
ncbi:MAG TPA: polyphenol oxidase family protein [Actinomycetota bacterium]|nr:polyphenol oxidase family protein [Actinomycetota bacterium]